MKTNLNLNSGISLQAIEAKARKAAVIASLPRHDKEKEASPRKIRKTTKKKPALENEISQIINSLKSAVSDSEVVMTEQVDKSASCRAIVSVYRRDDLRRQMEEERAYREMLSKGCSRNSLEKPFKAMPVTKYAFYPHALDRGRLGSVAIYGEDVSIRRAIITKRGFLFGHRVIKATLEQGRRLFLDVVVA